MVFGNDDVLNAFRGTLLKRGRDFQMPPDTILLWNTVTIIDPKMR